MVYFYFTLYTLLVLSLLSTVVQVGLKEEVAVPVRGLILDVRYVLYVFIIHPTPLGSLILYGIIVEKGKGIYSRTVVQS